LVEGTGFLDPGEDGAVPYFWPLGDKYILVFASHKRGSQYLLGDYDRTTHKFQPFAHGRFNFGTIGPGGVHAPSATPDGKGGVYVIHNVNEARPTSGWNHLMSLPRLLTLRPDRTLGIEPVAALATLRQNQRSVGERSLSAGQELVVPDISGNAIELVAEIDPRDAQEVRLTVLRSPGREEYTDIRFRRRGHVTTDATGRPVTRDALILDSSRASLHDDVQARPPEVAPFDLPAGELLQLRVFVDHSIVEVFAGGRQCVALRVYPQRPDSLGVSLTAQHGDAVLRRVDAWQMKSIDVAASDLSSLSTSNRR
jgi:beta-fructofuranosidase